MVDRERQFLIAGAMRTSAEDVADMILENRERARAAEHRQAELEEVLAAIVNRKWNIASPVHARPDNMDAATHLMCSVEKQIINRARAILPHHNTEGDES